MASGRARSALSNVVKKRYRWRMNYSQTDQAPHLAHPEKILERSEKSIPCLFYFFIFIPGSLQYANRAS